MTVCCIFSYFLYIVLQNKPMRGDTSTEWMCTVLACISLGNVAENISVCLSPVSGIASFCTIRLICGSKPISNIRSASSKTRYLQFPFSMLEQPKTVDNWVMWMWHANMHMHAMRAHVHARARTHTHRDQRLTWARAAWIIHKEGKITEPCGI